MNKKAENPTPGIYMTIITLIISAVFLAVLFTILFMLLDLLVPKPDSNSLAFYNRVVSDFKSLEPGMSMTELMFGVDSTILRGSPGKWAIVNFEKDYTKASSFDCVGITDPVPDLFQKVTRHESHRMRCTRGKPCTCLIFFSTAGGSNIITYSKCQALDIKYDLEHICVVLPEQKTVFEASNEAGLLTLNLKDSELNALLRSGVARDPVELLKIVVKERLNTGQYFAFCSSSEDLSCRFNRYLITNLKDNILVYGFYRNPSGAIMPAFINYSKNTLGVPDLISDTFPIITEPTEYSLEVIDLKQIWFPYCNKLTFPCYKDQNDLIAELYHLEKGTFLPIMFFGNDERGSFLWFIFRKENLIFYQRLDAGLWTPTTSVNLYPQIFEKTEVSINPP